MTRYLKKKFSYFLVVKWWEPSRSKKNDINNSKYKRDPLYGNRHKCTYFLIIFLQRGSSCPIKNHSVVREWLEDFYSYCVLYDTCGLRRFMWISMKGPGPKIELWALKVPKTKVGTWKMSIINFIWKWGTQNGWKLKFVHEIFTTKN